MKQMYVKNMTQANFFIQNKVMPVRALSIDRHATLVFNRDERFEAVFKIWVENGKKRKIFNK